jgi:uncharacterized membrane protein
VAAAVGLAKRDIPGLVLAAIGGGLLYRGATGHCSLYSALGVSSCDSCEAQGEARTTRVHIAESILIDKPASELYAFWRDFRNLPAIMSHLESVEVIDDRRSHWVAKAPWLVGGSVEWDAEITDDQSNSRIAWRSLPGSLVPNQGVVEFERAPGDRGTIVHVAMDYAPPAGHVGNLLARLFGDNPKSQIHEDLRNLKRILEIGDLLTTDGQPRGSCFAGIGRVMH